MNDFRELIDLWPTIPHLARALGQKPNTVHKWRQRNVIPVTQWAAVIAAASAIGAKVTADDMLRLAHQSRQAA